MFGKLKSLFKKKEDDIVAIVTIEREPRRITRDRVETMCRSIGLRADVKEEQPSYIGITAAGWKYVIFSLPVPYMPFSGVDFRDMRMNQMAREHTGYFVVECMEAPKDQDRKTSRKLLAMLAALIIDDQSMAIYDWTTARYAVLDPSIGELLTKGDIDGAVNEYSALVVGVQNEKVEAAIAEARERWPEFCAAFNRAEDKGNFLVKASFEWNGEVEHMWIEPKAAYPDRVEGILNSSPIHMPKPRKGDLVTRPVDEISDWSYIEPPNEPVGMFTEAIVRESLER
jgi:uncharacterized protein YegJ (DUF2314 family)